jgi:hypothetical protein
MSGAEAETCSFPIGWTYEPSADGLGVFYTWHAGGGRGLQGFVPLGKATPNGLIFEPKAERVMSAEEFRAALDSLGWTYAGLARQLGMGHRTVERWASGAYGIPANVADWLDAWAAFARANPLPIGWAPRSGERPPA